MEAFLLSTGLVALAEIGDKTQLLAFVLAARFRRPWPIIAGVLVATLVNHAGAGALGAWITGLVSPSVMRWVLGLGFVAMAVWTLIPDQLTDDDTASAQRTGHGIFVTTVIAFFLAEMGDKTQIATVALAAQYRDVVMVVAGTTFGMMIANVPAVLVGHKLANRFNVTWVHRVVAVLFLGLGVATLLGAGAGLGF